MSRLVAAMLALSSVAIYSIGCSTSVPNAPSPILEPAAASAFAAPGVGAHQGHQSSGIHGGAVADADGHQQIARLRELMAPFHNFDKAVEFGYSVAAPGPGVCISDPARGGMGYHYTLANKDLIGDGVVNLLEPEFIVYSPQPNGGVRLSAADYFVPYNTWPHSEPPTLLGVPFAREDAFQAYVLHLWVFWPNPAGIFENFNPAVPLCPQ